ncbi:alpha/beta fold hydrolase, partial [Streptomyces sp. NPDC088178]
MTVPDSSASDPVGPVGPVDPEGQVSPDGRAAGLDGRADVDCRADVDSPSGSCDPSGPPSSSASPGPVGAGGPVRLDGPWTHRDVAANGARFHIAELGEGPLVLLLHGFPQFWWTWRHQLTALADAGFRAVAMDLRGVGG